MHNAVHVQDKYAVFDHARTYTNVEEEHVWISVYLKGELSSSPAS